MLLATQPPLFAGAAEPDWVAKWIAERAARADKKEQRQESTPDPEAQAKRAAAREAKVLAGVDQLELWLCDLLRLGISTAPAKDYAFWDGMAARLVDSQAGSLARMVRELASLAASGSRWEERFLHRVASLTLAIEGYRRASSLPEELRADVRNAIGFTVAQDDVLAREGVRDTWMVVGRSVDAEDRLLVQRSWLQGRKTQRTALILDFAAAGAPLNPSFPTGSAFVGEVVFFPGALPQRALVKSRTPDGPFPPAALDLAAAHLTYRQALTASPWVSGWPMQIAGAATYFDGSQFLLRDAAGFAVPLRAAPEAAWKLVAVSGGKPLTVFGEFDGARLRPLTLWNGATHSPLEERLS
jgi:hypothetical protein